VDWLQALTVVERAERPDDRRIAPLRPRHRRQPVARIYAET
jgi:hypothetical protein